mgnify:CR=1 FL=1
MIDTTVRLCVKGYILEERQRPDNTFPDFFITESYEQPLYNVSRDIPRFMFSCRCPSFIDGNVKNRFLSA